MLCAGSAGSDLPLPCLRPLFGVEFRLDLRMGNGNKTPHKTRELAEITCGILRGTLRVIRHDDRCAVLQTSALARLDWSRTQWCLKVNTAPTDICPPCSPGLGQIG